VIQVSSFALSELIEALGGDLHGDPNTVINGIAPLETAQPGQISFLSHPKYQSLLEKTGAGCVIVSPGMAAKAAARGACVATADPYLYFARLTQWVVRRDRIGHEPRIHPTAVIHPNATVSDSAKVGALTVIESGARVGAETVIASRVTIGRDCHVGDRCIIHSGVVIGADGFGFAPRADKSWEKIEQLGAVRIGNDVEIGANTCIDRGALQDTVIADGVKLDNLIQIGHNVHVGQHTAMAGCVGVAGSAKIGAHCTVGGGAVILGHLSIADHVNISATTTVTRSISEPGLYTGIFPIDDNASWEKNAVTLRQLAKLRDRIRALEQQLKN
jgi:UDP-3-O-[3-hydroxymyristoyl] glucosamine N-acyltransferase